ncbi:MAG: pyridoxamine 5'-phosphate oxidase family protein [Prolixibacteraceae bacterium]|jgi:nitroimidazol reductase NimA-like FMN-containing flavoprotein (pyridoxamine 5'-phosphate oxidase superfamily)|nr:pyridoxamine 5'-phosphate oxidase family protein [Prolixibacteraceae bacterium]
MRTVFIEDQKEIEDLIRQCKTCFLGLSDENNRPYVVPMNFGYADNVIYLHSAQEGRKWEVLTKNPKACITFMLGDDLAWQDEHVACSWRVKSKTVIAEGDIEIVEDFDEKTEILHIFMAQYSDQKFKFNAPAVKNVGVMKMKVDKLTAKHFGAKAPTPWNK